MPELISVMAFCAGVASRSSTILEIRPLARLDADDGRAVVREVAGADRPRGTPAELEQRRAGEEPAGPVDDPVEHEQMIVVGAGLIGRVVWCAGCGQ